jgi:hypothetical protein
VEIVAVPKDDPRLGKTYTNYGLAAAAEYGSCIGSGTIGQNNQGQDETTFRLVEGITQQQLSYLVSQMEETGLFASVAEQKP